MTVARDHDVVCRLFLSVRRKGEQSASKGGGAEWRHADLARRGDPVAALDKMFRTGKVVLTDITDVRCEPYLPYALTTRAAEASAATVRFLVSLPDGTRKMFRHRRSQ